MKKNEIFLVRSTPPPQGAQGEKYIQIDNNPDDVVRNHKKRRSLFLTTRFYTCSLDSNSRGVSDIVRSRRMADSCSSSEVKVADRQIQKLVHPHSGTRKHILCGKVTVKKE